MRDGGQKRLVCARVGLGEDGLVSGGYIIWMYVVTYEIRYGG